MHNSIYVMVDKDHIIRHAVIGELWALSDMLKDTSHYTHADRMHVRNIRVSDSNPSHYLGQDWRQVDLIEIPLTVLWREHCDWALNTFGERPYSVDLRKMIGEAEEAIESGEPEEFADILLCFLSACSLRGVSQNELLSLAFAKLVKNKQRRWVQNPNGTWSHVKEVV